MKIDKGDIEFISELLNGSEQFKPLVVTAIEDYAKELKEPLEKFRDYFVQSKCDMINKYMDELNCDRDTAILLVLDSSVAIQKISTKK